MNVRIGSVKVDVLDRGCASRPCYKLGIERRRSGGRTQERSVCAVRQHQGCPARSVCPTCKSALQVEPGSPCPRSDLGCEGKTVAP
jgi:hypothetical protein